MESAVAVVTGTSRGLGLAVAKVLLERGWRVLGIARSAGPANLDPRRYHHARIDLGDPNALAEWMAHQQPQEFSLAGVTRLGLVNNAAQLDHEATHEVQARTIARALLVGAASPTWLMGWALRNSEHAALRIVNVSSGAATSAYPGWSAYCQTKAALDMASAVLGIELEEVPALHGRDAAVISYAPGVVDTAMQAKIRAADPASFPRRARFEALHARGELLSPATPAAQIADLLATDGLPRFSRRRMGDEKEVQERSQGSA